jgi:hypothetical protein
MTTELEKSPEISPFDGSSPRDWDALRLQSLAPGGFGDARAYIWHAFLYGHSHPFLELYFRPRLLHVDLDLNHDVNQSPQNHQEEHEPHQDERQIRLDTDRSFVLYPVGDAHPDPTSLHFHPYRIRRRQSGRRSARTPGRAQQTHRQSFPTTSGFELLSGQPILFCYSTHSPFPFPTEIHI